MKSSAGITRKNRLERLEATKLHCELEVTKQGKVSTSNWLQVEAWIFTKNWEHSLRIWESKVQNETLERVLTHWSSSSWQLADRSNERGERWALIGLDCQWQGSPRGSALALSVWSRGFNSREHFLHHLYSMWPFILNLDSYLIKNFAAATTYVFRYAWREKSAYLIICSSCSLNSSGGRSTEQRFFRRGGNVPFSYFSFLSLLSFVCCFLFPYIWFFLLFIGFHSVFIICISL